MLSQQAVTLLIKIRRCGLAGVGVALMDGVCQWALGFQSPRQASGILPEVSLHLTNSTFKNQLPCLLLHGLGCELLAG